MMVLGGVNLKENVKTIRELTGNLIKKSILKKLKKGLLLLKTICFNKR